MASSSQKHRLLYKRVSDDSLEDLLEIPLMQHSNPSSWLKPSFRVGLLYASNAILLAVILLLLNKRTTDPSLQIYCKPFQSAEYVWVANIVQAPANSAVEYGVQTTAKAMTSYIGAPDNDTDRMWEDLYQGILLRV